MKRIQQKKTYKSQMLLYSLMTIIIIISIMFFQISTNRKLIEKYNHSYSIYEKLGNFYDKQAMAHDSLKSYLYTKSEEELNDYKTHYASALEEINSIQDSIPGEETYWRFSLLYNMMESYVEQGDKVILLMKIQDREYATAYEFLLKTNESIIQSSDDYYRLVTESMETILQEIDDDKQSAEMLSVFIVVACLIGIASFAFLILRSITNPIDQLVNNIDGIKAGTFDFHKIPTSSKEMEVLCLALQDLSDNIHKNIAYEKERVQLENRLLIKENESLKKDELLISSELKMLQSQINPHFLFNAMNMIYQQALLEHSKVTVIMIEKMTECMRYTINQKFRTSTLHMELSFVENYIYIQNKRFEGRICFELHVEEDIPNIKIPAMIIEPLIDNSIKHGMKNTETDGLVTIYVGKENDQVSIRVSDNGRGMDTDALEALSMENFKLKGVEDSLGLYNLSRRLHMYYSKEATIKVSSFEDCGFDILIIIPIG